MLTMAMTPGSESSIIWIIRIDMDGSYMYFSTEYDKLTLDGIDFDGKVIDYPGDMEEGVVGNAVDGGNIGIVSNFTFSIKRYTDYSGASSFINDFYPATSKPLLTAKTVDVGITWRGATTLSQITWLKQYYIQDPKFLRNKIECFCVEFDELAGKLIPYYTVQKDKDDGVSYWSNMPQQNSNMVIPIIYGDFSAYDEDYCDFQLAPTVQLNSNNKYKICSHIVNTLNSKTYKWIDGAQSFLSISTSGGSYNNLRSGANVDFNIPIYNRFNASLKFHPQGIDAGATADIINCLDTDSTNYTAIAYNNSITLRTNASLSEDTIGTNDSLAANCKLVVTWKSSTVDNRTITLGCYLNGTIINLGSEVWGNTLKTTTIDIGTVAIKDIDSLTLQIENTLDSGVAVDIHVYNILIWFPSQKIYSAFYVPDKQAIIYKSPLPGWNYTPNMWNVEQKKDFKFDINDQQLFASVKGSVIDYEMT